MKNVGVVTTLMVLVFCVLLGCSSRKEEPYYLSLTDSLPDIWNEKDTEKASYAVEDTIPTLPKDGMIFLHYTQEVHGYRVWVEFIQTYGDLNFGKSILHFTKPGHSFEVYCDAFGDRQLVSKDYYNNVKIDGVKMIDLADIKAGQNVNLTYISPEPEDYLSRNSPFYFKDMDFDGEEELVVNNMTSGARGYNEYDIFKVFGVEKPLRLMGRPFNDSNYKITDYNVEYEPETQTVLDKRYDGADAYGHYRYKSISAGDSSCLKRVFLLQDAEDMGGCIRIGKQTSDTVCLIQPYKTYERIDGKMVMTERGVYKSGKYGNNTIKIPLE